MNKHSLARPFTGRVLGAIALLATLSIAAPALAHHPFGGSAPQTIFEGVVSGIGHPILGLDHLAFVIAVGLLAAVLKRGFIIPLAFLTAALVGTGLHLNGLNLPAAELGISISVLVFGVLATMGAQLSTPAVVLLSAVAGIFHGYAYGESIVGAEPTPLVAYLIGFSLVQGAIALLTYLLSKRALNKSQTTGSTFIRSTGFIICGIGVAFLSNLIA